MAVSLVSNEYSAKRSCQMSNRLQKQTSRFANTGLEQVKHHSSQVVRIWTEGCIKDDDSFLKPSLYYESLTLLATSFPPGCYEGGGRFCPPLRETSFDILTSFEIIPLTKHGRRTRFQKTKHLAQKLTKGRRIENLSKNTKLKYFWKLLPTVDKVALILPRMIWFWWNWSLWLWNYE